MQIPPDDDTTPDDFCVVEDGEYTMRVALLNVRNGLADGVGLFPASLPMADLAQHALHF